MGYPGCKPVDKSESVTSTGDLESAQMGGVKCSEIWMEQGAGEPGLSGKVEILGFGV